MDESEQVNSNPELSDSWMVINDSAVQQENHVGPSDGSDGESVEVIDPEEYEGALLEETEYHSVVSEEEITGQKNKKYVHHPNTDVNAALNNLMIITATVVIGLAVGHYLGYSEEVADLTTALKKLKVENTILKNHICKLFKNYVGHNMEYPDIQFRETDIDSTLYHMIFLDIKCPVFETLTDNVQTELDDILQTYKKGHLTEDKLKERIDMLFQNKLHRDVAISGKSFSKTEGEHIVSDQLMDDIVKDNLSTDDVWKGIDNSLQNEVNGQSFSKLPQSEGQHIFLVDETLMGTDSEVEMSEYLNKNNYIPETSAIQKPEGSVHNFKSHEKLAADNGLEKLSQTVPIKTYQTVETASFPKSDDYNVLSETTLNLKGTEKCSSNSELQKCLSKLEPQTENIVKYIVKDMVNEITESLLLSHHNNILKEIKNEAKMLVQSIPLFKSALLLNMEVISNLKSHVTYVKNTFQSFLDNSHGLLQQGKLASILKDVNKHTLTLEKAMNSLQLLEATLDQKKEFALKSQLNMSCTSVEFFENFYINTSASTETDKSTVKQEDNDEIIHGNGEELQNRLEENLQHNTHTEPKLKSNKNEWSNRKQRNNKHNAKYQDSRKMKRNKNEHKKEKREKFNKFEKKFKQDAQEIKKKQGRSNIWVKSDSEQRHSNLSGEWVINLNQGRAESRETEHRSDWLFDRASARNAKRKGKWDARNWYFERAESRNDRHQKTSNEKTDSPSENKENHFHGKDHKRFKKYFKPKYWISKAYMAMSKFKF